MTLREGKAKFNMNIKYSRFIKNFSYTLVSNLIALLISSLVTFIVPKAISVENYGYFQLYLFYATYVGFFHFGWMDGLFLRYGGAYYEKLDKGLFKGELKLYALVESVISVALCFAAILFSKDINNMFILGVTALSIVLINIRVYFMDILQCTNRIKEYSILSVVGRIFYLLMISALLLVGYRGFHLLIIADILGRLVSTAYGALKCRDIFAAKSCDRRSAIEESVENIKVGVKLLFATIASNSIIGIVRLGINSAWDVSTFGRVSLTLSISNLLMVFIRAVSLVLFPTLRRVDRERLDKMYGIMRVSLMVPMLGMLVLYYPIRVIVAAWLPQYAESLKYMALLFPMCIFESKMSMLVETYMKVLRKERSLMFVNIGTLLLSLVTTGFSCFLLQNLDIAVLSIVILLAFRCVVAELTLTKYVKQNLIHDVVMEISLTTAFILASWYVGGFYGTAIYLAFYLVYVFIKRKEIISLFKLIKRKPK